MSALATVRAAPGLESYLEVLELRLERAVGSHPGLVGRIGTETLAAGGKRLRPVLVFLATPADLRGGERPLAGGAAVELVHMATLVHDDLLDGARAAARARDRLVGARRGRRARGRRLPVRAGVRRAFRGRGSGRGVAPCGRGALARTRRGAPAAAGVPGGHVRRGLPAPLFAQDREALRGRVPAGRRAPWPGRVRPGARDRVPDRRRHPRLHGHAGRDRKGAGRRSARRDADAAAHPGRPRGHGRRPSARAAATFPTRSTASSPAARSRSRASWRSTTRAARGPRSRMARSAIPSSRSPTSW